MSLSRSREEEEEEEKGGWKQLALPGVGNVLKFIPCPQASSEGEKSLLQHELVPFITIITLAYLGASSWGDLAQQAEQDTRGCGGSTCRANKSRDASHCSRQDLRGQQLPRAWRSEPVLQKLRDNKSMLISRGVMPHRDTASDPPPRSRQSQLPLLPKSWELCHSRPCP